MHRPHDRAMYEIGNAHHVIDIHLQPSNLKLNANYDVARSRATSVTPYWIKQPRAPGPKLQLLGYRSIVRPQVLPHVVCCGGGDQLNVTEDAPDLCRIGVGVRFR